MGTLSVNGITVKYAEKSNTSSARVIKITEVSFSSGKLSYYESGTNIYLQLGSTKIYNGSAVSSVIIDPYIIAGQQFDNSISNKINNGTAEVSFTKTHSDQTITAKLYVFGKTDTATFTVSKKPSYNVTYNLNEGSGSFSTGKKWYNETFSVSSTKPTKTGYTFKGWTNNVNSTVYSAGGTIPASINQAITLTAKWEANKYTITYQANGGTGSNITQSVTYNSSFTTKASSAFSRTGYTFTGWGGSYSKANYSYVYETAGNTTLNAQWRQNVLTVKYNANGGTLVSGSTYSISNNIIKNASGSDSFQKVNYNDKVNLYNYNNSSAINLTRTGYHINSGSEWNTNSSGTGTSFNHSTDYETSTISSGIKNGDTTVTVYANWKINTYTISYNANGGSGAPSAQTKTYNQALTLSSTRPTRSGYRFLGWGTSSSASSATYQPSGSYPASANENKTLYAVWRVNPTAGTLSVTRCDSSGTADPMGAYVTCSQAWTAYSGKKVVFSCGSYSSTVNISGTSGTATTTPFNVGAKADTALTVNAIVYDADDVTATKNQTDTTEYSAPSISRILCVRVDQNNALDDEGTWGRVEIDWTVAYLGSQTAPTSLKITVTGGDLNQSQTTTSFTGTVSSSGTKKSGSTTFIIGDTTASEGPLATATRYTITIELEDSINTITRTDILTEAYFTMDVLGDNFISSGQRPGHGIAFGAPSQKEGFLEAMQPFTLQADDNNKAVIKFKSDLRDAEAIRFFGGSSSNYGDGIVIGDGGLTIIGGGESANNFHGEIISSLSDGEGTERLYLCSDNNIYFNTNCNTIANRKECYIDNSGHFYDSDGDTFTPKGYGTYYKNAELTLTTSAQKIALTSFSGYGMSATSNGIKVAKAGTYLVLGSAYFHSGFTANDIVHLIILKNGTYIFDSILRMYATSPYQTVQASTIVTCAANDVFYLYAYNQTAARGKIASRDGHGLSVVRLA